MIVLVDKSLEAKKIDIAVTALKRLCENNRIFDTHSDRISHLLVSSVKNYFNSTPDVNKELIDVLSHTALLNFIHGGRGLYYPCTRKYFADGSMYLYFSVIPTPFEKFSYFI